MAARVRCCGVSCPPQAVPSRAGGPLRRSVVLAGNSFSRARIMQVPEDFGSGLAVFHWILWRPEVYVFRSENETRLGWKLMLTSPRSLSVKKL